MKQAIACHMTGAISEVFLNILINSKGVVLLHWYLICRANGLASSAGGTFNGWGFFAFIGINHTIFLGELRDSILATVAPNELPRNTTAVSCFFDCAIFYCYHPFNCKFGGLFQLSCFCLRNSKTVLRSTMYQLKHNGFLGCEIWLVLSIIWAYVYCVLTSAMTFKRSAAHSPPTNDLLVSLASRHL